MLSDIFLVILYFICVIIGCEAVINSFSILIFINLINIFSLIGYVVIEFFSIIQVTKKYVYFSLLLFFGDVKVYYEYIVTFVLYVNFIANFLKVMV